MSWRVGEHYDTKSYDYETRRLQECGVEFGVTKRFLDEYLPGAGVAVDIGVGVGHYAAVVAQHGFDVHLVDVSERLLDAAVERLSGAGLDDRLVGRHHAAAQDLSPLDDECADAVLMLGPLYHLPDPAERRAAVDEARRVLRPGGVVFAAGINRLAVFRDLFISTPEKLVDEAEHYARFLRDGAWWPDEDSPLFQAHCTTIAELRRLFESGFDELELAGTESFIPWLEQKRLPDLDTATRDAWIDLAFRTSTWPEALGAADHLLYVGRRT